MGEAWGIEKYANVIKQKAQFLEQKGFILSEIDEYTIVYAHKRKDIKVDIYWGRYTDFAEVGVRFKKPSGSWEHFAMSWFRIIKKIEAGESYDSIVVTNPYINNEEGKLERILYLLEFLEENFDEFMNIQYCRKAEKKVNEYIEKRIFARKKDE